MEETLEEVCDRIFLYQPGDISKRIAKEKALDLAKWQQERMYSEDEVLDILRKSHSIEKTSKMDTCITKWFEQFKKK